MSNESETLNQSPSKPDSSPISEIDHRTLGYRVMIEMCCESRFTDELQAILFNPNPKGEL